MKFDLFADGIANVSITAGVVRIDFYVMRPAGSGQRIPAQRRMRSARSSWYSVASSLQGISRPVRPRRERR